MPLARRSRCAIAQLRLAAVELEYGDGYARHVTLTVELSA